MGKYSSEATKEEGEKGAIMYKIAATGNNIITTTLFKLQQNYNSTIHRCLYPIASKLDFITGNFTKNHALYLHSFLRSLRTNFTIQLISKYTICRLHFTFQYYIFHFIVGYCQWICSLLNVFHNTHIYICQRNYDGNLLFPLKKEEVSIHLFPLILKLRVPAKDNE